MSDIVVFEGDFVTDVCRQKQASVFYLIKNFACLSNNFYAERELTMDEGREATRAERDGAYPMEFIYTKRALDKYIDASKRVIEIGCGGGYYLMHYAPKCKEYLGVDLSPVNIQMTQEQIAAKEYENADAMMGDATKATM